MIRQELFVKDQMHLRVERDEMATRQIQGFFILHPAGFGLELIVLNGFRVGPGKSEDCFV